MSSVLTFGWFTGSPTFKSQLLEVKGGDTIKIVLITTTNAPEECLALLITFVDGPTFLDTFRKVWLCLT